ncbi:MAG TPA: bifunctional (p)ppGpp synthetase/guanosine-3',5'-bis(diphosphate) 3'-pyrophosphohydrolase [Thermomicrobiales bacterium]|nr:bifunctional (p)ppGpp synthetase/guanosine-3',5'-bis(diphosphate) 3'-pyrophosphohydrolase [Thermomicrobiales bacterium]
MPARSKTASAATKPRPSSHEDGPTNGLAEALPLALSPDIAAAIDRLHAATAEAPSHAHTDLVDRAVAHAIQAHAGSVRTSGGPYVVHPIEVATILARMHLDPETVAAGLLHDAVEDTTCTLDQIEAAFGRRVASLVDGVTKLSRLPWTGDDAQAAASREKANQAESLRKMFLAMVDDIGVVLIKLADRLHNMRTLDPLSPEKQQRIALQTVEIYAPLANRLGIWQIKSELEDLAFRYLNPQAWDALHSEFDKRGRDSEPYIAKVKGVLMSALAAAGIKAEITGRTKHIYSIFRKMKQKRRSFDEIYDVIGLRILVDDRKDCYGALGIIHEMWHPIPGEFDDYIATPKESLYQSLHTAVIGPDGRAIEIQIRTWEMHRIAEYGVAAHWRYKEGGKADARVEAKVAWLRQLMDWRDQVADAEEFVESLKSDVFKEMIYVFTPAGDIIELPAGATPVDFAYRIHTEVGHQCVGAKVNDKMVPLDYRLQNGEVVRIQTSNAKVGPSRDWLLTSSEFVTTASAREKIRRWFRSQERDENISQGRDILERELRRLSFDLKLDDILKAFPQYPKVDDFLAAIGYGAVSPQQIAARLDQGREKEVLAPSPAIDVPRTPARLQVMGVGDLLTNLATCCKPVNGDPIIGYVTRGRGITVHRQDCPNILGLTDPERLVPVTWGDYGQDTFPVTVHVRAWDRVGLLKDVSTLLADERVNIVSVLTTTHDDRTVTLLVTVEVEGIGQLSRILRKLEGIRDVYEVRRDASAAPIRAAAS